MTIYHTVYKVKNNLNNRFYIGVHSTKNPHDSYLGSGLAIKEAVRKYGKENFTKEILFSFDDITLAYTKEEELVTKTLIADPMCYNMVTGGVCKINENTPRGKDHYNYGKTLSSKTKKLLREAKLGTKLTKEHKRKISQARKSDNVRETSTCPNCGKTGQRPAMLRWHFENCRS